MLLFLYKCCLKTFGPIILGVYRPLSEYPEDFYYKGILLPPEDTDAYADRLWKFGAESG